MNKRSPSAAVYGAGSVENTAKRCILKSMGFTDRELSGGPIVGIANAWSSICPGHKNLRELAEYVKNGIYSAGGTAVEFGVTGSCDGLCDGEEVSACILPSRDAICDAIELQVRSSQLDAVVLMGSCDKIVPGMLMAAARLDIPAILVNGGPMLGGTAFDGRKSDQTSADEAVGMYTVGAVTAEQIRALEDLACPTVGSCSFLGTANTMCCLSEAMGMSLPGSALVPAVYAQRQRLAFEAGRAVCELARRGLGARRIITEESVKNAVRVCQAICGSTNAVMHLSAIAYEAELKLDVMREFEQTYRSIPQTVRVNPAAKWDMEDFYRAGGIPRVMKTLEGSLFEDALTCTGATVRENLASVRFPYPANDEVISPPGKPFRPEGSLAVLRGSLAPDTAVTKPGAFDPSLRRFHGRAHVFDSEREANEAILAGKIRDGEVVVIRYEGPKGGPGMREMYKPMKYLYGQGKATSTALITDGRFSGTNNGCFVGHISPEAAEGGPIALVRDGDGILIDVDNGRLELLVDGEELRRRRAEWKRPPQRAASGYLRLYQALAVSGAQGAMIPCRDL